MAYESFKGLYHKSKSNLSCVVRLPPEKQNQLSRTASSFQN